jgi:hypothetical protein
MADRPNADQLAAKAAEVVKQVIAEAEARAAEIIGDAEAKAASIRDQAEAEAAKVRERAEGDARAQIEAAKRALDELGGTLVAAASAAVPKAETEQDDTNEPAAAPEAPVSPPADEPEQATAPTENGDDSAERLVAMKLAVDGQDRAAIEAELAKKFGARDRSKLLDDVLARVAR